MVGMVEMVGQTLPLESRPRRLMGDRVETLNLQKMKMEVMTRMEMKKEMGEEMGKQEKALLLTAANRWTHLDRLRNCLMDWLLAQRR